jgi:hypothetical protein
MSEPVAALQQALGAEHAAVYAYGVLGARLTGAARADATAAEAAHRARRDGLVLRLADTGADNGTDAGAGAGATPTPASPAYTLPFPVTNRSTALRLAVLVEQRAAAVWRAAVPATTGADRSAAVTALTDCAVRATRWRQRADPAAAPTVAFPGG